MAAVFCSTQSELIPASIATASAIMAYQNSNQNAIMNTIEQSNTQLVSSLQKKEEEYKSYKQTKELEEARLHDTIQDLMDMSDKKDESINE